MDKLVEMFDRLFTPTAIAWGVVLILALTALSSVTRVRVRFEIEREPVGQARPLEYRFDCTSGDVWPSPEELEAK